MPALDPHRSAPAYAPYRSPLHGAHRPSVFWAGIWYVSTLAAWLTSLSLEGLTASSAAGLTSLAIVTELISVLLRWRSLTHSGHPQQSEGEKHALELVWLCAWGAQANALGLAAMLSPSLASMLPALLITAVTETLIFAKSPLALRGSRQRGDRAATRELAAPELEILSSSSEPSVAESDEESGDEGWLRSTHEGRTETGEKFLGGWVRYQLAADQKALALTVGFSPAFATAPQVELDQEIDSEDAHCEAQLEHVTPAGMRVSLKRSSTGAPLAGKLLWHASESEGVPSLLASRLP